MKFAMGLFVLLSIAVPVVSQAQKKKKNLNMAVRSQEHRRTQGPLAGGDGVFGSVYTLNSGWNFTILRARYTVDPFNSYEGLCTEADSKLLILSISIKNSLPADLFFGGLEFEAFDEEGHAYHSSDCRLTSLGKTRNTFTLKPGQGVGQYIVTLTVKDNGGKALTLLDLLSEQTTVLEDTHGGRYSVIEGTNKRHPKRDEAVVSNLILQPGEGCTFRQFYEVPQDATLKSVTFGQANSRQYRLALKNSNQLQESTL